MTKKKSGKSPGARKAKTSSPAIKPKVSKQVPPQLVVVGSVAQDILHTPFISTGKVLGGSAVHFANAASFFTHVGIVGVVGSDYPLDQLEFLRKRAADLSGIEVRQGESFFWEGRYLEHFLERETIQTQLGVFADFQPVLPELFRAPRILFLGAIHPALQLSVLEQVRRPKLVAIDTFQLWIDTQLDAFMRVLARSDLFLCNDFEVRRLTGEYNLFRGAEKLLELGPRWVVVKKGEHGSFLMSNRGVFLSHTYPVTEIVDPTGAGDAYAGGLLGYLCGVKSIKEIEIRRAMAWASVVGSFNVEGLGPDGLRGRKKSELLSRWSHLCKMSEVP